jgi:hypothetical protein
MVLLSGLSLGSVQTSAKVHTIFDAIIKGYGSKSIQKIVENLAGGIIPAISFTLPIVNVNVSLLDLVRYYFLSGGKPLSPNLFAIIATLLPLLFPNPTGPLFSTPPLARLPNAIAQGA